MVPKLNLGGLGQARSGPISPEATRKEILNAGGSDSDSTESEEYSPMSPRSPPEPCEATAPEGAASANTGVARSHARAADETSQLTPRSLERRLTENIHIPLTPRLQAAMQADYVKAQLKLQQAEMRMLESMRRWQDESADKTEEERRASYAHLMEEHKKVIMEVREEIVLAEKMVDG